MMAADTGASIWHNSLLGAFEIPSSLHHLRDYYDRESKVSQSLVFKYAHLVTLLSMGINGFLWG